MLSCNHSGMKLLSCLGLKLQRTRTQGQWQTQRRMWCTVHLYNQIRSDYLIHIHNHTLSHDKPWRHFGWKKIPLPGIYIYIMQVINVWHLKVLAHYKQYKAGMGMCVCVNNVLSCNHSRMKLLLNWIDCLGLKLQRSRTQGQWQTQRRMWCTYTTK